jgi:N-formylglutamate deformylase
MAKLYNLHVPMSKRYPLVASLPHSGTRIPRDIRAQFKREFSPILTPVDWHLEKLYDFLPELGVTMIQATHSRYVVNLNRGLDTPLFGPEPTSVVPDATCFGRHLYNSGPEQGEVERRVTRYYSPYHRQLAQLLRNTVRDSGRVYLVDLHSYYRGPEVDVCLGNVDGTTCSESLIGSFEKALRRFDFRVTRNEVWIGGHITRYYGSMDNIEALQIELRFPAYLDGGTFEEGEVPGWGSGKFRDAKQRLRRVFTDVIEELF